MTATTAFTPNAAQAFSFSPTMNGVSYSATVTWNVFGQRFYLNLFDLSSNLIVSTAVVSSGPQLQATFAWANGYAIATTAVPHNVPIGQVTTLRVFGTGTPFDGLWLAVAMTSTTLAYILPNPEVSAVVNGTVYQPLNLVAGAVGGGAWLVYHFDTLSFEYGP